MNNNPSNHSDSDLHPQLDPDDFAVSGARPALGQSEPQQPQAAELGAALSQARQQRGLEQSEAARQVHLPVHIIDKLERGDWDAIGTPVFLRGYLHSYCRLLGLPEPEAVTSMRAAASTPKPLAGAGAGSRRWHQLQRYAVNGTYLVITAAIVVPILYLGVHSSLNGDLADLARLDPPTLVQPGEDSSAPVSDPADASAESTQHALMASVSPIGLIEQAHNSRKPGYDPGSDPGSDTAASGSRATPASTDVATPPPPASALTIDLRGPSWVEVTAVDGERLEYALLQAGTHVYRHAGALTVRLGNVGAAEIARGGHTLDLEGYQHANIAWFKVNETGDLDAPEAR